MTDVRIALGFATCLATFATGCVTPAVKVGEVQEVDSGSYSMSFSVPPGFGDARRKERAIADAINKAGEYCHSKGQKLSHTRAVGNSVSFRCLGDPNPQ
jgi:hypothetical protein